MSVEVCLVEVSPGIVRVVPGDIASFIANVTIVLVGPGGAYAGIPYEEWARRLGEEVDLEALRDEVARRTPDEWAKVRPLGQPVAARARTPGEWAVWWVKPLERYFPPVVPLVVAATVVVYAVLLFAATIVAYFGLWYTVAVLDEWRTMAAHGNAWRALLNTSTLAIVGLLFLWAVLRCIAREFSPSPEPSHRPPSALVDADGPSEEA